MQLSKTCFVKIQVALIFALLAPLQGQADTSGQQTRGEKIVMKLCIGNGSAGYHIFEAKRKAQDIHKNLRKALYKVREADKVYAKSIGKPDSRYLEAATIKLASLKEKTRALENEISDAFRELKDSSKQALIQGALAK